MNPFPPLLHWSPSPVALHLWVLNIHWYGLCWMAAFLLADVMARRMFKAIGRPDVDVSLLLTYAFAGTLIGARLAHCLIYDPIYYLSHPLKILTIWEGGLASHGGAVGLIIGAMLGVRRLAQPMALTTLLDVAAVPAALGGALVRIGNFINSEIVGNPTGGPFGVVFDRVDPLPRHPVQLYESAAYLVIFAILALMFRRRPSRAGTGLLSGVFLTTVFTARILLEHWKTPQAAYEAGLAVSAGQLLSLPFVVLGAVLIWKSRENIPAPV